MGAPSAPSAAGGNAELRDLPMPDATLRPNVVLVHKDDEEDTGHVDLLQQPGTRRRARLPPRCCRPPVEAPAPGVRAGSAAAGGPADRRPRTSTCRSCMPRSGTPRWDDVPMVGRASELARLLSHVDRAARRHWRSCSPVTPSGKTRLLDELAGAAADRGSACSSGIRRPRRRRPALPAVRRPAAPGRRRIPSWRPRPRATPVLSGLLAGRPAAPVPRDGDLGRPLPNRAALQLVDDGWLRRSSRRRRCSASWPRPARC